MKNLRPGVSRLRAELEAATGGSVAEVTGASAGTAPPTERVCVGTEAVLHQLERADLVAFLDFDAELLAPRFRAVEQAMALLARAARLVGGRAGGGRILVQTAIADHPVIAAAALADPGRLVAAELAQRGELLLPPVSALALISGAGAADYISGLRAIVGVEIQGPIDGPWLVRAANHDALCDALGATPRPAARLRVEVDPLRI